MVNVIPAPFRIEGDFGAFQLQSGIRAEYTDAALTSIVQRFCRDVSRHTALRFDAKLLGSGTKTDDAFSIWIEIADDSDLASFPPTMGISPVSAIHPDERYSLVISVGGVVVRAREAVGVARGLTTLMQLFITRPKEADGLLSLPGLRILDVPRFAWRSFSLDVARRFFTVREVQRLIDLLALYKINVLNVRLIDDQGWRLPFGRPANRLDPTDCDCNDPFYSVHDIRELASYAAERFITLVPEVDSPGHASGIMKSGPNCFPAVTRQILNRSMMTDYLLRSAMSSSPPRIVNSAYLASTSRRFICEGTVDGTVTCTLLIPNDSTDAL